MIKKFVLWLAIKTGVLHKGKMLEINVPKEIKDVHIIRVYAKEDTEFIGIDVVDRYGQPYVLMNDLFGGESE